MGKRFFLTLLCVFFVVSSPARAEKIIMKDGTVIDTPILERGSYYIKVQDGTFPRRIFTDQIEEILSDDAKMPLMIDKSKFYTMAPAKVDQILSLIEINGARSTVEQNLQMMVEKIEDPAKKEQLRDIVDISSVVELMIPVYDKYYSEADLKQLIDFYSTPIGQKTLVDTPEIAKEILRALAVHIRDQLQAETF